MAAKKNHLYYYIISSLNLGHSPGTSNNTIFVIAFMLPPPCQELLWKDVSSSINVVPINARSKIHCNLFSTECSIYPFLLFPQLPNFLAIMSGYIWVSHILFIYETLNKGKHTLLILLSLYYCHSFFLRGREKIIQGFVKKEIIFTWW